jgi:hypothetical protein
LRSEDIKTYDGTSVTKDKSSIDVSSPWEPKISHSKNNIYSESSTVIPLKFIIGDYSLVAAWHEM